MVFSCSSVDSVALYEERLKPSIDTITNSNTPLPVMVAFAEKIVKETFAPDLRSTFAYKMTSDDISLKLDSVILAMLAQADEAGGESAQRYVASAILACSKEEDVVGSLQALGTTWLTHFLFLFKTGRGVKFYRLERGLEPSSFCENVLTRDGYTCVVTGIQDTSHPGIPNSDVPYRFRLECGSILRRALGEFEIDNRSQFFESAATSFEILVRFGDLPTETIEELRSSLADPSNGITLEWNAWHAFDSLWWCMKKTQNDNVYAVKCLIEGLARPFKNNFISFEDHSDDFSSASNCERQRSVALPNPRYIAIHSAVAEILHMSGAGTFFETLLRNYRDDERMRLAFRSWSQFESQIEEDLVRESVAALFQSESSTVI